VCYDWCGDIKPEIKDNVIFEIWWDEECYCLLHTPIQMQNMLGVLMGKVKIDDPNVYKMIRHSDHLFPITE